MTDLAKILQAKAPLTLAGVPPGFQPWFLADLARAAPGRAVFVASDDAAMQGIVDTAAYFAPELVVRAFPAWDCLPYDRSSPSLNMSSRRLATLVALQDKPAAAELIVTTVNALTQRTLTPFRVRGLSARLAAGERIDRDRLIRLLHDNGYSRADTVADKGEYAVRGGIVDLYPSGEKHGLRLDFFGDEIESIRSFDPADQRTTGRVDSFVLLPAAETLLDEASIKRFRSRYRERFGANATGDPLYQAVSDGRRLAGMDHWLPLFEDRLETLFDHLAPDTLWIRDGGTEAAAQSRFDAITDYHRNRVEAMRGDPGSYRPLPPETLYLSAYDWARRIADMPIHATSAFPEPESGGIVNFGVAGPRDFAPERTQNANVYDAVVAHAKGEALRGRKLILASYSGGARERLAGLLADHGLTATVEVDGWQQALGAADGKRVALITLPLDHGFTGPDVALLTEQDMLGDRLVRRAKRKKSADAFSAELAAMTPGDLVVHADHGIGRYEGLTSIPVGSAPHDCVALTYAGGDKLFVPVENMDVLSRYGSENEGVALDRLGGEAWQRRKARMKQRIREIAGELLATAAMRAIKPAEIALPDAAYPEFVDRFAFEETDDQDRAIAETIDDLARGRPMDRLVCGDVGFGKTEVALRAAFVAAMAGWQVALVCPTTLLARQHFINFTERFKGFPINIGRLSRLVPAAEAKKTREELEAGTMDIVIGTHAILSKTVKFKRLGLVVVDEEQRFGVTQKEKLKALRADVHILTLTATPIPRTLQMAMSGLRDLSVIQTPPVDRLAVRTYVTPWDAVVIREALLREHYRGGQSYFVTPRVADLPDLQEFLRTQVPEINFITAHGQMAPTQVEERMSAFYDRKYDVLLSTTIVESGLDIPSANTLIVNRADRFGLAQLYQLRGRVGRSKTRAYAYFATAPGRILTETAEKRLKILADLDTLGAGFQLASHDLDIRGAGNLVGDEQSGHIREVGFELYQSMLEDAIVAAKAGGGEVDAGGDAAWSPQITVDAPILIPETYVPDLALRMGLYRRLNGLDSKAEIESFAAEMIDRFGPIPAPTENLLRLMEIKQNALRGNIAKIDAGPKGAIVAFRNDHFPNVPGLLDYVERLQGTARLRPDQRLVITRAWKEPAARLHGIMQLSKGLAKLAS
ncbi:MAG: transcription-repair coupling factor [Sphingomonadales bacterium]|nr:transcription-repair coupling factor [Sphingomonadales bacterium]